MDRRNHPQPHRRRRGVRIATFGTVVGIVTSFVTIALGAFDLRDKVSSVEAGDTSFVTASYTSNVGDICDQVDDDQDTRHANAFELRRRVGHTLAFGRQRTLVLEYTNRELDLGDHNLSTFQALGAPDELAARHRALVRRWTRHLDRVRAYRDRLEAAPTRARLEGVARHLNRSLAETEARNVETGLRRLGGSECDIGAPKPLPVVTLPRPAPPTPEPAPGPGPAPDPDPDPGPDPPPDVVPPADVTPPVTRPAPPNVVAPKTRRPPAP
jgi:hypothetical protein